MDQDSPPQEGQKQEEVKVADPPKPKKGRPGFSFKIEIADSNLKE